MIPMAIRTVLSNPIDSIVTRILRLRPKVPGRPPLALATIGLGIGVLDLVQLLTERTISVPTLVEVSAPGGAALLVIAAAVWTTTVDRSAEKHASAVIFSLIFMAIATLTVGLIFVTQLPYTGTGFDFAYAVLVPLAIGAAVGTPMGFIFDEVNAKQTRLEQQYDRTIELNQRMQVLNRVLRHNVRNELTVALGRLEMANEETSSERVREWLADTKAALDRLHSHSEQLLMIESVPEDDGSLETIDIVSELEQVLQGIELQADPALFETSLPERALVQAHPMIGNALAEAIENALQHNEHEGLTISIDVTVDSKSILVEIADTGEGIPQNELAVWEADIETALQHSQGVGLWFLRWVTEDSGGEVVLATSDEGTTIRFELPRASKAAS